MALSVEHGLAVIPSRNDDKHFAVDAVNQLIASRRLRIHRRCVRLIEQLYSTVWNRNRSEWERTDKDHGDLIDCLVYLCRAVRWHRDCRPAPVLDRGLVEAQRMMMGRNPHNLKAMVKLR
jgi:hypothetical protein